MLCDQCQCIMKKNGTRKGSILKTDVTFQKWICDNNHSTQSILSDTEYLKQYNDKIVFTIMENGFQKTATIFNLSRHYLYSLYDKWISVHKYKYDIYPTYLGIHSIHLSGQDRYMLIDLEHNTLLDIVSGEDELFETYTNDINHICINIDTHSKNIAQKLSSDIVINLNSFIKFCFSIIEKKFNKLCHEFQIAKNNNYGLNWENFIKGNFDFYTDDFEQLHKNILWLNSLCHGNPPTFLKNIYETWKTELELSQKNPEYDREWKIIENTVDILQSKKPQKVWNINKGNILYTNKEEIYHNERFKGISIDYLLRNYL